MAFIDQIQGENTTLRAVVFFSNPLGLKYVISSADEPEMETLYSGEDDVEVYPLLKSFPTIKEKIDVETRKYTISSVRIELYNQEVIKRDSGLSMKFSDMIVDSNSFTINSHVSINYIPNNTTLYDASFYTAYTGKIKYIKHDEKTISITLEDSTQDLIDVNIPKEFTPTSEEVQEKIKNIPYPIVYGFVPKSPCIFSSRKLNWWSEDYTVDPIIYFDKPTALLNSLNNFELAKQLNFVQSIYTTNIYIGSDGEYLDLARYSVTSGSGGDSEEIFYYEEGDSYIRVNSDSPDLSQSRLRGYIINEPLSVDFKMDSIENASLNPTYNLGVWDYSADEVTGAVDQEFELNQVSAFSIGEVSTSSNVVDEGGEILNYNNTNEVENINSQEYLGSVVNGSKKFFLTSPEGNIQSWQRIMTYPSRQLGGWKLPEHYSFIFNLREVPFSYPCDTYLITNIKVDPDTETWKNHVNTTQTSATAGLDMGYHDIPFGYGNSDNPVSVHPIGAQVNIFLNKTKYIWLGGVAQSQYGYIQGSYYPTLVGELLSWTPVGGFPYYTEDEGGALDGSFSHTIGSLIGSPNQLGMEDMTNQVFNFDTLSTSINAVTKAKSTEWTSLDQYNTLNISLQGLDYSGDENDPWGATHSGFPFNSFSIRGLKIFQVAYIPKYWEESFYVDVHGRAGGYDATSSPAEKIIIDLISQECPDVSETNLPAYQALESLAWFEIGQNPLNYAFTQKKEVNAKKLIEEFAKYTILFPMFKGDTLDFKTLKPSYDPSNPLFKKIHHNDVINFNFKRTDSRNLYNKIKFDYNYDFSTDNYMSSISYDVNENSLGAIPENYDPSLFGIENKEEHVECRFIYNEITASTIAKYTLMNKCIPHNIINLDLPLRYINYELGDVVKFDRMILNQKIYGEDYSVGIYNVNGMQKYGLFLITSVSKTDKLIKLELYQLHDLTQTPHNVIPFCPLGNYEEYEPYVIGINSQNPNPNAYYVADESLCNSLIDYEPEPIYGCTNNNALNYDTLANTYDGSCVYLVDIGKISAFGENLFTSAGSFNTADAEAVISGDGYEDLMDTAVGLKFSFGFSQEVYYTLQNIEDISIDLNMENRADIYIRLPNYDGMTTSEWDKFEISIANNRSGNFTDEIYSRVITFSELDALVEATNPQIMINAQIYYLEDNITMGIQPYQPVTYIVNNVNEEIRHLLIRVPILHMDDEPNWNLDHPTAPIFRVGTREITYDVAPMGYKFNYWDDPLFDPAIGEGTIDFNREVNCGFPLRYLFLMDILVDTFLPSTFSNQNLGEAYDIDMIREVGRIFYGNCSLDSAEILAPEAISINTTVPSFSRTFMTPQIQDMYDEGDLPHLPPFVENRVIFKQKFPYNNFLDTPLIGDATFTSSDVSVFLQGSNNFYSFIESGVIDSPIANFMYPEELFQGKNTYYILMGTTNPNVSDKYISSQVGDTVHMNIRIAEVIDGALLQHLGTLTSNETAENIIRNNEGDNTILSDLDDLSSMFDQIAPATIRIQVRRFHEWQMNNLSSGSWSPTDGSFAMVDDNNETTILYKITNLEADFPYSFQHTNDPEVNFTHNIYRKDILKGLDGDVQGSKVVNIEFEVPASASPDSCYYFIEITRPSMRRDRCDSNIFRYSVKNLVMSNITDNANPSDSNHDPISVARIINGNFMYTQYFKTAFMMTWHPFLNVEYVDNPMFIDISDNDNDVGQWHSVKEVTTFMIYTQDGWQVTDPTTGFITPDYDNTFNVHGDISTETELLPVENKIGVLLQNQNEVSIDLDIIQTDCHSEFAIVGQTDESYLMGDDVNTDYEDLSNDTSSMSSTIINPTNTTGEYNPKTLLLLDETDPNTSSTVDVNRKKLKK